MVLVPLNRGTRAEGHFPGMVQHLPVRTFAFLVPDPAFLRSDLEIRGHVLGHREVGLCGATGPAEFHG